MTGAASTHELRKCVLRLLLLLLPPPAARCPLCRELTAPPTDIRKTDSSRSRPPQVSTPWAGTPNSNSSRRYAPP